jgi:hypothetical protein
MSFAHHINRLLRTLGYQVIRADTFDRLTDPKSLARRPDNGGVAYSCVVDQDAVLLTQCFIWLNCLMKIQRVPCRDIFVHMPDIDAPAFVSWLESCNVNLVPIRPFDRRNPHCNKLRQLDTCDGSGRLDRFREE